MTKRELRLKHLKTGLPLLLERPKWTVRSTNVSLYEKLQVAEGGSNRI
jgi:hypothetical protein